MLTTPQSRATARCAGHRPAVDSARLDRIDQADRDGGRCSIIVPPAAGHGMFDVAAYQSSVDDQMADVTISDEAVERSLAQLPRRSQHPGVVGR